MNGTIVIAVLIVALAVAIRMSLRRAAAQRAAHDVRLKAMAQSYLAAARKKKAAEDAAAAKASLAKSTETPANAGPSRDERECPFCAELILKKARVCKHCGRDVEPIA